MGGLDRHCGPQVPTSPPRQLLSGCRRVLRVPGKVMPSRLRRPSTGGQVTPSHGAARAPAAAVWQPASPGWGGRSALTGWVPMAQLSSRRPWDISSNITRWVCCDSSAPGASHGCVGGTLPRAAPGPGHGAWGRRGRPVRPSVPPVAVFSSERQRMQCCSLGSGRPWHVVREGVPTPLSGLKTSRGRNYPWQWGLQCQS